MCTQETVECRREGGMLAVKQRCCVVSHGRLEDEQETVEFFDPGEVGVCTQGEGGMRAGAE